MVAIRGCDGEETVLHTFPAELVAKADIVDTNGCGDAFVGKKRKLQKCTQNW
jgi:sugar/nucleoside kinase (ribokinase family)